jgi:hypothetical protein
MGCNVRNVAQEESFMRAILERGDITGLNVAVRQGEEDLVCALLRLGVMPDDSCCVAAARSGNERIFNVICGQHEPDLDLPKNGGEFNLSTIAQMELSFNEENDSDVESLEDPRIRQKVVEIEAGYEIETRKVKELSKCLLEAAVEGGNLEICKKVLYEFQAGHEWDAAIYYQAMELGNPAIISLFEPFQSREGQGALEEGSEIDDNDDLFPLGEGSRLVSDFLENIFRTHSDSKSN